MNDNRKNPRNMHRDDPAGIHFFSFWAARAKDGKNPRWLRITSLAYSSHRKNGHATFCLKGESTLCEALGLENTRNNTLSLQKEIRSSIARGFLAPGSNIRCLVLPDEICGGAEGHLFADCQLHRKTKSDVCVAA
ncbi:hypothetical protein [Mycolicibacterium aubagnense]|uniref:Uncharacterized protein n=1 Tax=Mycolicibacterium aubagnense TaxID=319707 RepID=A0ABM7IM38_9MYCO|nr:hypothetical protein [Mycolicibacterium aubagnense]TLH64533.1 hypothetical protein C1S80_11975 [Mycolicibacterium aubagnense]WGI30808.1 hypothetical protein QDT91_16085 [Mycolicibacterium aubagnense]BBX87848.1 hypothetical protein MAUB_57210 [Mycolicibacterium aubagnense]